MQNVDVVLADVVRLAAAAQGATSLSMMAERLGYSGKTSSVTKRVGEALDRNGIPRPVRVYSRTQTDECKIGDCSGVPYARNLCMGHYRRLQRTGKPERQPKVRRDCAVSDCSRDAVTTGWCKLHYERKRLHGDPEHWRRPVARHWTCAACGVPCTRGSQQCLDCFNTPRESPDFPTTDKHGYKVGYWQGKQVREHRWVMEQHFGRELRPEEQVHHRNGDRSDNAFENLELWSTSHPRGQRVIDKVEYAAQLFVIYDAASLSRKWRHVVGTVEKCLDFPPSPPVIDEYRWTPSRGYLVRNKGGRIVRQHREVMAQVLGRPLRAGEEVHHRNGDRSDNRPQNLELWVISHPAGQRVSDKLKWAEAFLLDYAPMVLAPSRKKADYAGAV